MKEQSIVAKAREIIKHHQLPDFIVGFDVRLGDIDGDAAMWIVFKTIPGPTSWGPEAERHVAAMNALQDAVMPALLEAFDDRFPYFRYEAVRDFKSVSS